MKKSYLFWSKYSLLFLVPLDNLHYFWIDVYGDNQGIVDIEKVDGANKAKKANKADRANKVAEANKIDKINKANKAAKVDKANGVDKSGVDGGRINAKKIGQSK